MPDAPATDLQFIPEGLSEGAAKQWASIRPRLVDAGIANNFDKEALMQLCEWTATLIEATQGMRRTGILIKGANGHPVRSPYLAVVNEAQVHVTRLLTEFGMTPSSRSKIISTGRKPSAKKGGAFADL
jgi:P27 family predicted phage terminase small subunit